MYGGDGGGKVGIGGGRVAVSGFCGAHVGGIGVGDINGPSSALLGEWRLAPKSRTVSSMHDPYTQLRKPRRLSTRVT